MPIYHCLSYLATTSSTRALNAQTLWAHNLSKEAYSFKLGNLCNDSDILEGLFFYVMGRNIRKPLTICNIYRPPHDNNSNDKFSNFLSELSPVLDILQKENAYAAVVGDFNINILQINERENLKIFLT